MNLIIITTKGRFVPKEGDNSGFAVLSEQIKGNPIYKKLCDQWCVYVTKCLTDESMPQLDKHNHIAELLDIVEKDSNNETISEKYLIVHDGDLLPYKSNGNRVFREEDYPEEKNNNNLYNRIPNDHIYIFMHELNPVQTYRMFNQLITKIKGGLTIEHIINAQNIIKDEAQ